MKRSMNRIILFLLIIAALFVFNGCTTAAPDGEMTIEQRDGSNFIELETNEEQGGHVIAKHIGKSDEELIQRLKEDEGISASSTFADLETAEWVINQAIRENVEEINQWLHNTTKERYVLYYEGEDVIGRGISRDDDAVQDLKDAKVVLARVVETDYFVLTAYPTF